MDEASDLKMLYRAPDPIEAALLAEALESGGIPTRRVGGHGGIAFGEVGADILMVELWVPRGLLDEGRRLIEQHYAAGRSDAPAPVPWTCENCGERNDGEFRACWNCQTARA